MTATEPAGGNGQVAVTRQSLHLPGADAEAGLLAVAPALAGVSPGVACEPERAHELLGRKGLLGKDAATRMALCAVHRALGLPPRADRAAGPADPGTAVIASSNLGNLASVLDIARAVRAGGRREVSPLAAPNASSNVVASTVAIWFRFGGPNLMVCSGATAGLDAIAIGMLWLRAGRASRVVVVGTEPADADAVALHELRVRPAMPAVAPLRAVAACVVLEPARAAPEAPLILGLSDRSGQLAWPGPGLLRSGQPIDVSGTCGDMYGAQGVALMALAAWLAAQPSAPPVGPIRVVCGDAVDGWRTADVASAAHAAEPVSGAVAGRGVRHDRSGAVPVAANVVVRPARSGFSR